jgi:acetylornithine deacetylase/succinyl-diaminopimelate desuccinylase-like protein
VTRQAVFDHIAAHRDEHVARLQEFVRQPAVSATGEGMAEAVEQVADYLRQLGCAEVEIVPTDGHPSVFAYYDAGAPKTIVNYGMYDVNAVDPTEWERPPFSGDLVATAEFPSVLYGRGAFFAKGPYRAWLNALQSIISVEGTLPVNIFFVVDGEEEIGSPHFHQVIERFAPRLKTADATLSLGVAQNRSGDLSIFLGNKGFLYFELEASGERWGYGPAGGSVHGSVQSIVDSPAWRLIHAVSTLTESDGRTVRVAGFLDHVRPRNPKDLALLQNIADRLAGVDMRTIIPNAAGPGRVQRFVDDLDGMALLERYLFTPTFNIDGLYGGYIGPGSPTFSLPDRVVCNMDIRLVPDQEPEEIAAKLRRHLDLHGYEDIECRVISSCTWAKTPSDADIVQASVRAYRRLGHEPFVWPLRGTGGPWYLFNRVLELPTLKDGGLGHGRGFHAPNEFLVIEGNDRVGGLVECEQSHVEVLYSYAAYPDDYE